MRQPSATAAQSLIDRSDFLWHQRWEIVPGVVTPGANDIAWLLDRAGFPADLSGRSVLDIGTTNGAAAFIAEARGARRVVAVDIYDPERFGFAAIADLLSSRAEFVQASIYELAAVLEESFDVALCLGVLYHLRHPLLALDNLFEVTGGDAFLETAVCDHELGTASDQALMRFYRGTELAGDASNWWAPTVAGLADWWVSAGFEARSVSAWPEEAPSRALIRGPRVPGPPEWQRLSYERPLRCSVLDGEDAPRRRGRRWPRAHRLDKRRK